MSPSQPSPKNTTTTQQQTIISAFKAAQSKYRRRPQSKLEYESSRSTIIDFSSPQQLRENFFQPISNGFENEKPLSFFSSEITHPTQAFTLKEFPGFLYLPGALPLSAQLELAYWALSNYCELPHMTNIDSLTSDSKSSNDSLPVEAISMWEHWKNEQSSQKNTKNAIKTKSKNHKTNSRNTKARPKTLQRLSWSTMGYHYDWTERSYRDDCHSTVPSPIQTMSRYYAQLYFQYMTPNQTPPPPFDPTACILNYYKLKSLMGGHSDNLEYALDKPVISLSLGLPAIFLLGGRTKEDSPVIPILIRPGDVMFLGGKSRLRYHGMARVISLEEWFQDWGGKDINIEEIQKEGKLSSHAHTDLEFVKLYLSKHRMNLNVRQVLPDGVSSILEMDVKDVDTLEQRKKVKRNVD